MSGPPPDKTATLSTADYASVTSFNDAVTALYQQGYEYAFAVDAHGTIWVVFQGYTITP